MPLWGFLCWLVVAGTRSSGYFIALSQGLIFKLEEEGKPALLLLLLCTIVGAMLSDLEQLSASAKRTVATTKSLSKH
jgi:hypothetical protein